MRKLWLFLLMLLALTSCKTRGYIDRTITESKEVGIPIYNTKIEYRDRFVYDSIYIHDSINTIIKGDTVYISKNRETNRLKSEKDTVIIYDTIQVPIEIVNVETITETQTVEVNRLYWWQKALMCVGITVLVSGSIIIVLRMKRII